MKNGVAFLLFLIALNAFAGDCTILTSNKRKFDVSDVHECLTKGQDLLGTEEERTICNPPNPPFPGGKEFCYTVKVEIESFVYRYKDADIKAKGNLRQR